MRDSSSNALKRQLAKLLLLASFVVGTISSTSSAGTLAVATEVAQFHTQSFVEDMALSSGGSFLATLSPGDGVKVWNVANRNVVISRPENGVTVGEHHLDFSRDGRSMIYCNGLTRSRFDTTTWQVTQLAATSATSPRCVGTAFSADSSQLVTLQDMDLLTSGSDLVAYDTASWLVKSTIRMQAYVSGKSSFVGFDGCKATLSPVDDRIFLASEEPQSFFQPEPDLRGWSLSPDGRFLAISGAKAVLCKSNRSNGEPPFVDGRSYVAIIDLAHREFVRVFEGMSKSIDWSSDGRALAVGPEAGEWGGQAAGPIRIVDRDSGRVTATEATNEDHVLLRYTPDGKYLIEAIGKRVEIWDASHAHMLQTIRAEPVCIAVSGDGRYLALGGAGPSLPGLLGIAINPNGPSGKVLLYRLQ